ncbi:MAG: ribosome biogenesis GTPase Der [Acidobacteriaceae bacterium]
MNRIPLVALIGLPNAGKSTLFNKILERRKALTHPEAGTTRDRHYGRTVWNGSEFFLVDTAGIISRPGSDLEKSIQRQTAIALSEADLIVLVADGRTEVSSSDFAVAKKLSRSKKPVLLAVNKIDSRSAKTEAAIAEFKRLGLNEPIPISAINGSGVGDLLDMISSNIKSEQRSESLDDPGLKLAFVGKPNVGKSSLVNKILGTERQLVHEKPGTTRSTVDIPYKHNGRDFVLLDTAGVKKKWKQDQDTETAAAMQTLRTIPQADVIFFVLASDEPITFQDQVIASQIIEQHKPVVVVLNKIDKLSDEERDRVLNRLPDHLPHMWWAPVVFASAKTGSGLEKMFELAFDSFASAQKQISIEDLDGFLEKMLKEHMPGKMADQRAPKLYNLSQISVRPPMFRMTVNFPAAVATAWKKYFEKQFRLKFGFEGTPIEIKYEKRK